MDENAPAGLRNLNPEKLSYLPNQTRWDPFDLPDASGEETDFISGLRPLCGAGDPKMKDGLGIYVYVATEDMSPQTAFYSADGDLLVVPQQGSLDIRTEMGRLLVRPHEIIILPRGIKYRVDLVDARQPVRGYALEIYHGHFQLPELGPIGSNGLANPRDFLAPVACFDDEHPTEMTSDSNKWTVTVKFCNGLFSTSQPFSPFNVVAWHGNYYPLKYDLGRFNTMGTISYDHPDPSIFTVLTATGSGKHGAGTALADFVIFPPRWVVGEDTFRPPYFHRNVMTEFMGLLSGVYDAKKPGTGGFSPGGASLHNVMSGHGPDVGTADKARNDDLQPAKVGEGGMAFMFETCLALGLTKWGLETCRKVQPGYSKDSWSGLKVYWKRPEGVKDNSCFVSKQ